MLITKATGTTETKVKPNILGENGAWLMKVLLARNTSVQTTHAIRKAIQWLRFVPCLGCVLETAEMMIPDNAGPTKAIMVNGANMYIPLLITRIKEYPNPQEMEKVMMKKDAN